MIGDPQDASIYLILKSLASTRASLLIGGDRIKELALSLLNEANRITEPTFAPLLA